MNYLRYIFHLKHHIEIVKVKRKHPEMKFVQQGRTAGVGIASEKKKITYHFVNRMQEGIIFDSKSDQKFSLS